MWLSIFMRYKSPSIVTKKAILWRKHPFKTEELTQNGHFRQPKRTKSLL